MLPRFVQRRPRRVGRRTLRYITLEDLIANHLGDLFPGMEILEHHVFRVTRNEDVEIEEDETENLIQALEKELLRRRFGPPIRLEITDDMDDVTLGLLVRELDVTEQEVYRLPAPLDLGGLFELAKHRPARAALPAATCRRPAVQLQPTEPNRQRRRLRGDRAAATSCCTTRTSRSRRACRRSSSRRPPTPTCSPSSRRSTAPRGDSPIVEALIDAAEAGKQVLALVEIKARFDEQANITWARKLEKAGVHVVYGLVGLKTHCKLALVIRQEKGGLRHYSHIGTGNYNPKTSRIYEDLGLLTADDQVGKDLTRLFNELSGYAIEKKFKRLLVAPLHLRKGLLKRIAAEIRERRGRPAVAASASRSTRWSTRRSSTRSTGPVERRRARRRVGARHLQPAARRPGPQREHPGALDPRPLPRALAHLLVRERRRPAGLHRLRRHDAPQPRSPRRGARAAHRARRTSPRSAGCSTWRWTTRTSSWRLDARRRVDPPLDRRSRACRSPTCRIELMHADRPAQAHRETPVTSTAVYAAGAVCWRVIDGKVHVLVVHRTRARRCHHAQGQGRPGRVAAADRRARDRRGDRARRRARRAARRLAYPLPSGREKIVHYWSAEVSERAVQQLDVQAERRDRRARVGDASSGRAATSATSPTSRSSTRSPKLVDQGVTRTFALIAAAPRQGGRPRRLGRPRCRAPADRSAASSRRPASSHTLTAWAPQAHRVEPAVRCVTTVAPLARRHRHRRSSAMPASARTPGRRATSEVRRVVGKRVRAGKTAVLCSHGPVLPEIMREIALATGTPLGSYVTDAAGLEPGAFSVVHLSATNSGRASSRSRRTRRRA